MQGNAANGVMHFHASVTRLSVHDRPTAIRSAARSAARDLWHAIDENRLRVAATGGSARLIGRPGDDIAVASGIRIAPGNRRPRRTGFERLHLRSVSSLFVLIVERSADAIADQAADRRADYGSSETIAGAAAHGIADQTADTAPPTVPPASFGPESAEHAARASPIPTAVTAVHRIADIVFWKSRSAPMPEAKEPHWGKTLSAHAGATRSGRALAAVPCFG
jgi:hypothetical protein